MHQESFYTLTTQKVKNKTLPFVHPKLPVAIVWSFVYRQTATLNEHKPGCYNRGSIFRLHKAEFEKLDACAIANFDISTLYYIVVNMNDQSERSMS